MAFPAALKAADLMTAMTVAVALGGSGTAARGGVLASGRAPTTSPASADAPRTDALGLALDDGTSERSWSKVETGSDVCDIHALTVADGAFAPRRWTACGPGCSVAPATFSSSEPQRALRGLASAAAVAGDVYVRVGIYLQEGLLLHVAAVSSGATIAALMVRGELSACSPVGHSEGAPLFFPFAGSGYGGIRAGRLPTPSATSIEWSRAVRDPGRPTSVFAYDGGWGMTFLDGSVRVSGADGATDFAVVERSEEPAFRSAASGDLAIWSGWDAAGRRYVLKGYAPRSRTVSILARPRGHVGAVAASSERAAWIDVEGPHALDGRYAAATLHWASTKSTRDEFIELGSTPLSATTDLLQLQTARKFAAVRGCDDLPDDKFDCYVAVVDLATGRTWRIRPRPGNAFSSVLAVSDDEILLGEVDASPAGHDLDRLVRLETRRLNALETGW